MYMSNKPAKHTTCNSSITNYDRKVSCKEILYTLSCKKARKTTHIRFSCNWLICLQGARKARKDCIDKV
ncbi:hypothetical protein ANTPLA_LOCUS7965 [Anthophora plagiata]